MNLINHTNMNRLQRRAHTAWKELSKLARGQGWFIANIFIDRTIAIINLDGPDICIVPASYQGLLQALAQFKRQEVERVTR